MADLQSAKALVLQFYEDFDRATTEQMNTVLYRYTNRRLSLAWYASVL